MKEKGEIPCIFYLYIHSKLAEHSINYYMNYKDAKDYLHEWRIPSHIRVAILKELETLGLITRHGRNLIKINKSEIDFNNINKIYELVGLLSFEDEYNQTRL